MSLVDRVLLLRADEQCRGARLPADGRDTWDIGRAHRKPGPKGPRTKLSPEQVRRVRVLIAEGVPYAQIGEGVGCSRGIVQRIGDGSAYAEVA